MASLRVTAAVLLIGCGPLPEPGDGGVSAEPMEDAGLRVVGAPDAGLEPMPAFDAGPGDAGAVTPNELPDAGAVTRSWRQRVIYLVLPDRFVNGDPTNDQLGTPGCFNPTDAWKFHGGDWAGLTQRLPYLTDLGVNAVWMTPPNLQVARCGYHGYWADLSDPNDGALEPRFGTAADLTGFIGAAHARDVSVVLDLVVNHTGKMSRLASQRPDWFHPQATCASLGDATVTCPLNGMPDFAQERDEVARYLDGVSARWLTSYAFDGIRMDTAKHVPRAYFRDHWFPAVRAARPGLFTVAEVYDESSAGALKPFLEAGFDSVFNFPLKRALVNCFARGGSVDEVASVVADDVATLGLERTLSLTSFVDNHDMPRFVSQATGTGDEVRRRYLLALTALFTLPGIPQLYSGDELGVFGGTDPDNRRDFPAWGFDASGRGQPHAEAVPRADEVFRRVQQLVRLRTSSRVLADGAYAELWRQNGASNPNVFAFGRWSGSSNVVVVINASTQPVNVDMRAPAWLSAANHDEVLGEGASALRLENGRAKLTLPARASAIFVSR